ncbi:MAG TPA: ABC transporter substrate-binding protein [Amycolatopsis sp.]|nr:ABC transporter substrate-binding protein [Amycolatopsis sp.]
MHRTRLALVAVAMALVIGPVTACAGSGGSENAGANGALIKVNYEPGGESFIFLPTMIAVTQNYFRDAGVDLNYQPLLATAALQVNAVVSGQSDIAATGTTGLLSARQQNQPLVGIGYQSAPPDQFMVLTKRGQQKLASTGITQSSPIGDRVRALKGLQIAGLGAGSSSNLLLAALLNENGLKLSDVTLRGVNGLSDIYNIGKADQVDAIWNSDPFATQAVNEGWGKILISYPAGDVPSAQGVPWTVYVASTKFVNQNPEGLKRFLTAIWRAVGDLQTRGDDPAITAAVKAKYFPTISDATYKDAWHRSLDIYKAVPIPTEQIYNKELALWNSVSDTKYTLPFDQVYNIKPVTNAKPTQ